MYVAEPSNGLSDKPGWLFVSILGLVSGIELLIMVILPLGQESHGSRILLGLVDSAALSVLLMPLLWWMLVLPLRRLAEIRLGLIDWSQRRQEALERQIAGNLHDEVGQMLTGISLGLKSLRDNCPDAAIQLRLVELSAMVRQAHDSIRSLSRELRPAALDHLGLAAGLQGVMDRLRNSGIPEVELHIDPRIQDHQLPSQLETAIFRIAQEAASNCLNYSRATKFQVDLSRQGNSVHLVATDNGVGFDIGPTLSRTGPDRPFGLLNMIERAKILGGQCRIVSGSNQGTRLEALLPIPERAEANPSRR